MPLASALGLPFWLFLIQALHYVGWHEWPIDLVSQFDVVAVSNPLYAAWDWIRANHPLNLNVSSIAASLYIQSNPVFANNPFELMDSLYDLWCFLRSTEINFYLINGGHFISDYGSMTELCMYIFI